MWSKAFARFNFVAIALTWLFQFNLLSILTPRYLPESVGYILFPYNYIFMLKASSFLLGLKIISSVFETFSQILLALSQFGRFFRSIFKSLLNLFSDLLIISRFVSSAKWWTLQCFITTCKSLMYIRAQKQILVAHHMKYLKYLIQSYWLIQIAYGLLNTIQAICLLIRVFRNDIKG